MKDKLPASAPWELRQQQILSDAIASTGELFDLLQSIKDIPYHKSRQLTRDQVERLAFDVNIPEIVCAQFQRVLNMADNMIKGEDKDFPGVKFHPDRILFILWEDGLKIWID